LGGQCSPAGLGDREGGKDFAGNGAIPVCRKEWQIQQLGKPQYWELAENKRENPLQVIDSQRVSGGLVGIDQEVVTLRGPLRHNSGPGTTYVGRSDLQLDQANSPFVQNVVGYRHARFRVPEVLERPL
jgi:hypothetical protein